jgi:hypothetical protein
MGLVIICGGKDMCMCVLLLLLLLLYCVVQARAIEADLAFIPRLISPCVCISSISGRMEHGLAWSGVGRRTASATSPGSAVGIAPVAHCP